MARQPSRDNPRERELRSRLHSRGRRFRVYYPVPGRPRRTIDIALPGRRLAIFLDGCFWHSCPEHASHPKANHDWWGRKFAGNRDRDADTNRALQEAGWTVLRFWEHESLDGVVEQLEEALAGPTGEQRGAELAKFTLEAWVGADEAGYPAIRYGEPWNGWETPVVTRAVLASILDRVREESGEPHRWDGDVAVVSGAVVDGPPEYEDRIEPNLDGHYDIGGLGWTWVRCP